MNDPPRLTAEVAALVDRGLSEDEIRAELHITQATLEAVLERLRGGWHTG